MDAASLNAMDAGSRMQALGNVLYPQILACLGSDALAGKVTGMLLEGLDTAALLPLLSSADELKKVVGQAVDSLPVEMLDELGGERGEDVAAGVAGQQVVVEVAAQPGQGRTGGGLGDADAGGGARDIAFAQQLAQGDEQVEVEVGQPDRRRGRHGAAG